MTSRNYFNATKICSFNAPFNFIKGARGRGKSWAFKIRAVRRFWRTGEKTLWLRRFEDEAKQTAANFFKPVLMKKLGLNENNYKWDGRKGYLKNRRGKWVDFIEVMSLAAYQSKRSADDEKITTIVYDEYTTTPEKYRMYRGNEVEHFIDLFVSIKREHKVFCYFLGNSEAIIDPFMNYFGIRYPHETKEGYFRFKDNSVILCLCMNTLEELEELEKSQTYDGLVYKALKGTNYFDYMYHGATKGVSEKPVKRPLNARKIWQFDFGSKVSVYIYKNELFCESGIDSKLLVFTDKPNPSYKVQRVLRSSDKQNFDGFVELFKSGKLHVCDENAIVGITAILRLFNLI